MKKDNTIIRKFFVTRIYELRAMEEYLEKMAADGYFFVKRQGAFWYFKKSEPKKVKFYVDIFKDSKEQFLEYMEYCTKAGWNYICSERQFQFFYSEDLNAVPIETDNTKKFRMINKGVLFINICSTIASLSLLLELFGISFFLWKFSDGPLIEPYFFIHLSLIDICWPCMVILALIFCLLEDIHYANFFIKNKRRLANGQGLIFSSLASNKKFSKFYLVLVILLLLCFLGMLASVEKSIAIITICMLTLAIAVALIISKISSNKHGYKKPISNTKIFIISVCAGMLMCSFLLSIFVNIFNGKNSEQVKYIDENGEEAVWIINHADIPYTLEDAGFTIPENEYRQSSLYTEKYLFYSCVSASDECMRDMDSDASLYISYDKYSFLNNWARDTWLQEYFDNTYCNIIELPDKASSLNAEAVYSVSYKTDEENSTQKIIVFDKKCYILSDNLTDIKAVIESLG